MTISKTIFIVILSILITVTFYRMASTNKQLITIDFEVFGKVQGVFFRKHTAQQAERLKITGWCMNTASGTVKGQLEGTPRSVDEMKSWLQKIGSPSSKIEKAEFSNEKTVTKPQYSHFKIRR
ncbi:acylphosphatase-2-like isoform X1 [Ctenocephalides felis]|uniref:acylphosphatase-2-like isoform X1 n=2 Tax=Ctenocephalides felis TaxID=7515 RepID=UPI000E6E1783|nr:acylphosphatase-2-like isoform X1 [Ctenocephalides felis]